MEKGRDYRKNRQSRYNEKSRWNICKNNRLQIFCKNIDLNQVFYGLQLQLLTYLNETCKVEDFIPAGVLYFNLINPTIGTDKNLTDEEVEEKIRQEFKMKGLILADVNIIKKMDTNIENEPKGISKIIPATIKKTER